MASYIPPVSPIGRLASRPHVQILQREKEKSAMSSRLRRRGLLLWTLATTILFTAAIAHAQGTGTVSGKVTEGGGRSPIPYADVRILGTHLGGTTGEDGTFVIRMVPVGTQTVQARLMGRDAVSRTVSVNAGQTAAVNIDLGGEQKTVKTMEEITVTAVKLIDTKTSSTKQAVSSESLKDLPVENLTEAVGLKAGVVATGGELHFRGGRSGEVKMQFDGVEVTDPLFGRGASVANLAVASADVLSGGFDAEFGNALSGIVNVQTREGGSRFGGEVQWHTDRYGESVKTFNNYDRFTFGFGGPTPIKGLTYYGTYEGTWSDTYLKSNRSETRHDFFDWIKLGNRQSNSVNANVKVAYTKVPWKLTVESINNRGQNSPYLHQWNRSGYVSVTYDTTFQNGQPLYTPKYGKWSFAKEDSTYQFYNAADHTPTTDSQFRQLKAVWTHSLTKTEVYTMRFARNLFLEHTAVQNKEPWEYQIRSPYYWSGNLDDNPYYVTHGDYPVWTDRRTIVYSGKGDFTTTRFKGHTLKTGFEGAYNEFHNLSMQFPNQESRGLPGLQRSDFVNYNPEGAAYVQDRWEYEGLVLNAGMRFDMFSPGQQISQSDLRDPQTGEPGNRVKTQMSPRLGIAYPVSDRDVLSFYYGWTFQTPQRNYVFENRGSQSNVAVRGNPNLQPETNIAYQAGMQHLFSKDLSGQFSVFFKDIFGLIAVRQVRDELTNLLVPVYVNQDYASSRGFEASLTKRFSHKFSGEVNYTYSIASGVASDPNQGLQFANGNLLYLPISERPLDWDQRHTLSASLVIRDPSKWGVNLLWTYGSGLPYTPTFRDDRKPDPRLENSRRLPSESTLSIVGDLFFNIWGQKVTLFVDARNVLDSQNIFALSWSSFPDPYVDTIGNDYLIYYTETGRPGGAYLKDTNGDGREDWVPVNDPRVWAEGRNVRVGLGVSF
jgi:outer membrane receptor for ferrienterochelin and colicin